MANPTMRYPGGKAKALTLSYDDGVFEDYRLIDIMSLVPCCVLVAHAFGRLGCFFAGCCYGKETDSPLGVQFPHLPNPVHPTQLYEAAFLFVIFIVMLILLFRYNFRHNMSVYLISYGIFRFLIEFVRGDHRGELVAAISPSQFWSIPMVLLGVGLIFLLNYLQPKRDKEIAEGRFVESKTANNKTANKK